MISCSERYGPAVCVRRVHTYIISITHMLTILNKPIHTYGTEGYSTGYSCLYGNSAAQRVMYNDSKVHNAARLLTRDAMQCDTMRSEVEKRGAYHSKRLALHCECMYTGWPQEPSNTLTADVVNIGGRFFFFPYSLWLRQGRSCWL